MSKALGGCDKYISRRIVEILLYAENNDIDLNKYTQLDNAERDAICNRIVDEIRRNFYRKYSARDDVFLLCRDNKQLSLISDRGQKKARGKRWTQDMVD